MLELELELELGEYMNKTRPGKRLASEQYISLQAKNLTKVHLK